MAKLNCIDGWVNQSLLQSSVSHDPSKIISYSMLIWCPKKNVLLLILLKKAA